MHTDINIKAGITKNKPRFSIKPQFQGRFEKQKLGFELLIPIMFKPGLYF